MAHRGRVRRRPPFGECIVLADFLVRHWRRVDGLCAYQGVDPLVLQGGRLWNLVEHVWRSLVDKTGNEELDGILHDAALAMRDFPHSTNEDGSPAWWTGEEEAGAEFMALLNRGVPGVRSSAADPAAPAEQES